jgi:hypothetical protein
MIRPGWFYTAAQKSSIVPANLNPQDPHPPPGRLDQVARGVPTHCGSHDGRARCPVTRHTPGITAIG